MKSPGRFSKQHFIKWGWINFLKEIGKTKVFDVAGSGKNSLDCAMDALLLDVLIYASEEKCSNEAQYMDFESERSRHK